MKSSNWRSRIAQTDFVTWGLLAITVLVFILETFSGGSTNNFVLITYGARFDPLILAGQWWRLITPVFVHIGFMHILVNGISLYFLGQMTERLLGHWRFLALYLVSGFAGNVISFAFRSNTISAGASTAIFGLLGAYVMLGDSFKHNPAIRQISQQFLMLIGINLVFNLFSSSIDIYGHIGGLIGGFLVTGLLGAPRFGKMSPLRRIASGATLILGLSALLWLRLNGSAA